MIGLRFYSSCAALFAALFVSAPLYADPAEGQKDKNPAVVKAAVEKVGRALDRTAKEIEEFGSMHMSAPLLSRPGNDFKFDFQHGASNYFIEAKTSVQGAAATFEQVVQSFQGGLAVQADPIASAAFLDQLSQFQQERSRFRRKQDLTDSAAHLEYLAAIQRANQITNTQAKSEAIAAAERAYAEKITSSTNAPAFPSAGSDNLPDLPQGLAKPPTDALNRLARSNFFALRELLPTGVEPVLNNRAALITAAGDVAVESIFRLLGQPDRAKEFMGREIVFGVATMSVNPGWRTSKDFAADLSVMTGYRYQRARKEVARRYLESRGILLATNNEITLSNCLASVHGFSSTVVKPLDNGQPLDRIPPSERMDDLSNVLPSAFAVSPLTETEALDLSSSYRRQNELALNLAVALRYAGAKGQAEAFEQFVKSRQSDFRTRSAAVAVNTYSDSAGLFGVQIGPRFRAIENPGDKKFGEPANVLDRQSFPLLVIFGIDTNGLEPKIRFDESTKAYEIVEPVLTLVQVPHWRPLKHGFWFPPRQSEVKKLRLSYELHAADSAVAELHQGAKALVEFKERALKWHAFGGAYEQTLPVDLIVPPSEPPKQIVLARVTSLVPSMLTVSTPARPTTFTVMLAGDNMKSVVPARITEINGRGQISNPRAFGNAIAIDVTIPAPTDAVTPLVFELPLDLAKSGLAQPFSVLSPPFRVVLDQVAGPTTVIHTSLTSPDTKRQADFKVEISGSASAETLGAAKAIVESELQRSSRTQTGGNANISVNVEATEQNKK